MQSLRAYYSTRASCQPEYWWFCSFYKTINIRCFAKLKSWLEGWISGAFELSSHSKWPGDVHLFAGKHTCQPSRFSRESPSFSSNLPVSRLEHQISREIPNVGFFNFFFHQFRYFRESKKENKTKSGFSALIWAVLNWKTSENGKLSDQIDTYLTRIVIGQKSTNPTHNTWKKVGRFSHAVYTQSEDCQHEFRFAAKWILRCPSLGLWGSEETCFTESEGDSSSWHPAISNHSR